MTRTPPLEYLTLSPQQPGEPFNGGLPYEPPPEPEVEPVEETTPDGPGINVDRYGITHSLTVTPDGDVCGSDGQDWPCEGYRMLMATAPGMALSVAPVRSEEQRQIAELTERLARLEQRG